MDLQALSSQMDAAFEGGGHGNPFLDSFPDPICKLNLKETSEFVKSFPTTTASINGGGPESRTRVLQVSAQRKKGGGESSVTKRNNNNNNNNNVVESPSTPGRPIFSFSVGSFSRKSFPSKWDDAEKWVVNGTNSCHDSPAHIKSSTSTKQCNGVTPKELEASQLCRVADEKAPIFQGSSNGVLATSDVLLKDKFTSEVETITCPNFRPCESMKEGFLFGKTMNNETSEVVAEVKHRDIGTEMTPIGSSTTSRCHTPFKSLSPARHNTPASRSGPLLAMSSNDSIDIAQLQECHLAKLQIIGTTSQYDSVTTNWSSREEEEEDISKSLRHFEMNNECRKSVSESRVCPWEEEEKTKHCLRYQRELAKIQAWVNLQNAKTEAQSKKLEVKIQKMRSNLEEKLMKRMCIVHRKAEEWRAVAELQHSEQIQKVNEQAQKKKMMINRKNIINVSHANSCGCFPCCNNHHM